MWLRSERKDFKPGSLLIIPKVPIIVAASSLPPRRGTAKAPAVV